MALIVEDGTGLATAESYLSVADADTYHTSRGTAEASWVGLDEDIKEQCLRRATDYMVQAYRGRWKGYMVLPQTQVLDWPRYQVYPDASFLYTISPSTVPSEVKKACAELAMRANVASLTSDVAAQGEVTSESVGPISVAYSVNGQRQVRYSAIDHTLGPLLVDGDSGAQGTARLG
jgi:hypothetical protein